MARIHLGNIGEVLGTHTLALLSKILSKHTFPCVLIPSLSKRHKDCVKVTPLI